jgi:hypothetical protein
MNKKKPQQQQKKENGKMRLVESIPGMGGGGHKGNDGEGEFNCDKSFCKCHNVSPSTI